MNYLMEHDDEIYRLEVKTDIETVQNQARWAGIEPGMRVADIGCGPGKTSHILHQLVQPGGEVVGIDFSEERLHHAQQTYAGEGLTFARRNIVEGITDLGQFDFVWVRFFLEYHRKRAFQIVKKLSQITNPDGILCLIDLDNNCMNHYQMPDRLALNMEKFVRKLEQEADFDPYMGRKLYSFLYDINFTKINVALSSHHLIYGELEDRDAYNWAKKLEVAFRRSGSQLVDYPGGYDEFYDEFITFFSDPRRLTYTPLIACSGRKPC
jgi:ubiquinone/menaquinone biosynthesis C-methylase UbiE